MFTCYVVHKVQTLCHLAYFGNFIIALNKQLQMTDCNHYCKHILCFTGMPNAVGNETIVGMFYAL